MAQQIRRRRIFKNKIIIMICIIAACCASFLVILVSRVNAKDPSAEEIYNIVMNYDYSNGRDESLEAAMNKIIESSDMNDIVTNNYIYKAKAEYFYNIGKYHTALLTIDELENYQISSDDQLYMADFYIKAYEALGNYNSANYYRFNREVLTTKCENVEE